MFSFRLDSSFVEGYRQKPEPFGFGDLGKVTFMRTYSRIMSDGSKEQWVDTCERVINGMYSVIKNHCVEHERPWSEEKGKRSAEEAFDGLFNLRWSPPGRGLWSMGSEFVMKRGVVEGLQNCGFVSTEHIDKYGAYIFYWFMEKLMLGVGVGADVEGSSKIKLYAPDSRGRHVYTVEDSREGWAESVQHLIQSYFGGGHVIQFDYSDVRPKGEPIRGFGGVASGPGPLRELHESIRSFMDSAIKRGGTLDSRALADIFNAIGVCVIAGNVRRSAEILLGQVDDDDFLNLKNYERNPERAAIGWTSNNSILAKRGMSYTEVAQRIRDNGEPGLVWLENINSYGRMGDSPDYRDRAVGVNPCQPSWATVLTPDGIRKFGEVGVGDKIWSSEGWTKIVNKWSTGVKPVYNYQHTGGQFVGTSNHRLVTRSGKVEAENAKNVMVIPGEVPDVVMHIPSSVMDGMFFGDGYFKSGGNERLKYPVLIIGQNDQDYFSSEVTHLIDRKMEDRATSESWVVETSIDVEEKGKVYDLVVPERYKFGTTNEKASFLRGLFSANGSVVGDRSIRVTLKTTSPELRDDVILMLSSLGIRSYYTTNKARLNEFENGIYQCRESYDVNVSRDADIFASVVGFVHTYKMSKLIDGLKNKTKSGTDQFSKRVNVEYIGDYEVFDITVDNESHTYWTGGLNVSNCGEQPLESFELCTLVELYPTRNKDLYELTRSIKFAYLYGKAVTLLSDKIQSPQSREVMTRNRRIGLSMTGVAQFVSEKNVNELIKVLKYGYEEVQRYDRVYSHWFGVNESIRKTTVKPSGSVSLLAGVTPGIHYPESQYYIRRMRIGKGTELESELIGAGYDVEDAVGSTGTSVVSFPVSVGDHVRSVRDVSIWEQFMLASVMQKYWSDNGVSVTVSFDPEIASSEISNALAYFEDKLKAVSMLPRIDSGAYPQMPYEEITKEEYEIMSSKISTLTISEDHENKMSDMYCDGVACEILPLR